MNYINISECKEQFMHSSLEIQKLKGIGIGLLNIPEQFFLGVFEDANDLIWLILTWR